MSICTQRPYVNLIKERSRISIYTSICRVDSKVSDHSPNQVQVRWAIVHGQDVLA